VSGLAILALLQAATGGGFVEAMMGWRLHGREPGLLTKILTDFSPAQLAGPVAGRGVGSGRWPGQGPTPSRAGLSHARRWTAHPAHGQQGWSALELSAAPLRSSGGGRRLLGGAGRGSQKLAAGCAGYDCGAILALATTQVFPLPTTFDEAAARTLYGFVQDFHRKVGGPFLTSSPDLVYFLVGEQTEIEGTASPISWTVAHPEPWTCSLGLSKLATLLWWKPGLCPRDQSGRSLCVGLPSVGRLSTRSYFTRL